MAIVAFINLPAYLVVGLSQKSVCSGSLGYGVIFFTNFAMIPLDNEIPLTCEMWLGEINDLSVTASGAMEKII